MPTTYEGTERRDLLAVLPESLDTIGLGLNLRLELEGIEELAASIAEQGQLQPGVLRRNSQGELELVAGFRRMAALKLIAADPGRFNLAGPMPFLARLMKKGFTEEQALVANLRENLDRRNLSPIDEGHAAQELAKLEWSTEKIAEAMRATPGRVRMVLSLMALPKRARVAIHRGTINEAAGKALLAIEQPAAEIERLVGELESGSIRAADLAVKVKAKKRAEGRKQARTLAEVKLEVGRINTGPAADFLEWIKGELPDSVLDEIFAEVEGAARVRPPRKPPSLDEPGFSLSDTLPLQSTGTS